MRMLALMAVAVSGLAWLTADAQAADRLNPFQLPQHLIATSTGAATIHATPVRVGWGWRGPGYYPGMARPYATYGYGYYRPYGYYGRAMAGFYGERVL